MELRILKKQLQLMHALGWHERRYGFTLTTEQCYLMTLIHAIEKAGSRPVFQRIMAARVALGWTTGWSALDKMLKRLRALQMLEKDGACWRLTPRGLTTLNNINGKMRRSFIPHLK